MSVLSESELRVLGGGGQAGCAICEQARRNLLRRGYIPPPLVNHHNKEGSAK